jgi:hypothetical protein
MPARGFQHHPKPFKPQRDLKHPRTHSTLRTYAKRRAAYNAVTVVVLCIFISRFLPELRAWQAEQRRIAARSGNKKRQRRHRRLVKLNARIARIQTRRTKLGTEIAALEERVRVGELNLRKHATVQDGFKQGWTAEVPMAESELKAQSYSRRFIDAYLGAVAERKRVEDAMEAQRKPVSQPTVIRLN